MLFDYNTSYFLKTGNDLMGWGTSHSQTPNIATTNRQFRSAFGVNPLVCRCLWESVSNILPQKYMYTARPKHLLMALLFLKQYNTNECNAAITGVDEKTFRKWLWLFVGLLAELDIVSTNAIIKNVLIK